MYDAGTAKSGIVCAAHILVATEAEAHGVLDRLDGGADFAELATSESTDTGVGRQRREPAVRADRHVRGRRTSPSSSKRALAAEIGEPFGPVQSEFGYHVIVLASVGRASIRPSWRRCTPTRRPDSSERAGRRRRLRRSRDTDVRPGHRRRRARMSAERRAPASSSSGSGPGARAHVTVETLGAIERIPHRFLRTARHPSAHLVPDAVAFDDSTSRPTVRRRLRRDRRPPRRRRRRARRGAVRRARLAARPRAQRASRCVADDRVECDVLPAMSFLDVAWARLGIDPVEVGRAPRRRARVRRRRGRRARARCWSPTPTPTGCCPTSSSPSRTRPATRTVVILQAPRHARRGDHAHHVGRARPHGRGRPPHVALHPVAWPRRSAPSTCASTSSPARCASSARGTSSRPTARSCRT